MVFSNVRAATTPILQVIVVVQHVEKKGIMLCTRPKVSHWVVQSEARILLFATGQ